MKYNIPFVWQSFERVEVEAEILQEAIDKVFKQFMLIPDEHYIDGTFELDDVLANEYPNELYSIEEAYKKLDL